MNTSKKCGVRSEHTRLEKIIYFTYFLYNTTIPIMESMMNSITAITHPKNGPRI